jgi:hypothetical protein
MANPWDSGGRVHFPGRGAFFPDSEYTKYGSSQELNSALARSRRMKQNYYQGQTFRNESIELSGNRFHGCTFEKCKLIYRGDISPTFKDNHFIDSVFEFADAAMRTIYFLSGMYHAGNGGREIVEDTFERIRRNAIHGAVTSTIAPQTPNHSLE